MCRIVIPVPRPAPSVRRAARVPATALAVTLVVTTLAATLAWSPAARATGAVEELPGVLAGAEESLRQGELQVAESRYREVLGTGWRILGELAASEGRTDDALEALRRATRMTVEHRRASTALALLEIEAGREEGAVRRLQGLLAEDPEDLETRRLLAAALFAADRP